MSYSKDLWQQEREREMSDAYERLNDEAEMRTGELPAREFYERYKPGRDCDPPPIEEVSFEEELEWEEIKKRREELSAHKHEPVRWTHDQRERVFQAMRDILLDHGVPFPRANFLSEKLLKAFDA